MLRTLLPSSATAAAPVNKVFLRGRPDPPAAVLTTHLVLRSQLLQSALFDTERLITAFMCIKSVVRTKLFNCYSVDMTRVRQSEKRKTFSIRRSTPQIFRNRQPLSTEML